MTPSLHPALRRAFAALWALLLLPAASFADEGKTVLHFTGNDNLFLYFGLGVGLFSILIGGFLCAQLLNLPAGSDKMQSVGKAIREGALAYLGRQVMTMLGFVVILAIGLYLLFSDTYGPRVAFEVSICFVFGVACSYSAGYSGMLMAVNGNMRTAHAALTSYKKALETAFRSGSVTGLMTVGIGLSGACLIFLLTGADSMKLLVGFGFGSSLAALFMRVGGGIFTKAADVGADLVGKVEAGIPEDDPRNPATIADNVGDNVGDCAGMAADVFESYTVTLIASIILAAATSAIFDQATWMRLVIFALAVSSLGVLGSIVGIFAVKGSDDLKDDPMKRIRLGFIVAAGLAIVGAGASSYFLMGGSKDAISTNSLVSAQKLHRDKIEAISKAKAKFAARNKQEPFEINQSDFQASDELKALGYTDTQLQNLLPEAFNFRPEDAAALPNLDGYRRLDLSAKSESAGQYTVANPLWDRGDDRMKALATQAGINLSPDRFVSLQESYGQTGKSDPDKELAIFTVKVSKVGSPPDAESSKEHTIGPTTKETLDREVKLGNISNTQSGLPQIALTFVKTYPASFYVNPVNGRLVVAVDGDFDPETLEGSPPSYFKSNPDLVNKAALKKDPTGQQKLPDSFQSDLAVIKHTAVPWYLFLLPVVIGIVLAFGIEQLTDYYVSTSRKPTQEVAGVATAGAAPLIIQGFSYALESSVFMVVAIVIALMTQLWIFPPDHYGGSYLLSFYGIALVGLGLLTTTGFILAMDTFGPISDNAQGVFEMSGETDKYGSTAVQRLDAAGNTTKALTKGFAIATAVIAAVALFHSFLDDAHLAQIGLRLDLPEIFLGLLIGGAAPYLFSAFSINAVGRAAFELIHEVRRQFRNDPGIMEGTSLPDYAACVSIVTKAAQRELLAPGILAISLPVLVGFGFSIGKPLTVIGNHSYNLSGVQALGGFLAGAILSGQLMAVLLANAGGIWDNAKKLIEDGLHGGKGSEAHKASVVGDTVGDPFKDTAGPALNPLIKVMNLVSLLLAPTFVLPLSNVWLGVISGIALLLLAGSMYLSKKGSMSSKFQDAAHETEAVL